MRVLVVEDERMQAEHVAREVTGLNGLTFGYDSASRLTTVATGDVTMAAYAYDAFDRRVRKTTPEAVTTYLYDGWNLVREEIAGTNGTTDVIEYYWGKDISGSLDTAGGIGGLLYLKRNGAVYVPLYDASGNVTAYVDASGNVVAEFAYDAFGNTVAEDGTLAGAFRFRYSTKYFDAETGLIYYGYRYYAPTTARWLTRDPLEEQGGLNLHCFCENDGVNKVDWLGMISDPSQANDARRFWRLIARRLREEKEYKIAAKMLELSLDPRTQSFKESSEMAVAIKASPEYDSNVKLMIDSYPEGWRGSLDRKDSLDYGGGDLCAAANRTSGKIDVQFKGRGCKDKTGLWFKFKVKISSEYSYASWRYDEVNMSEGERANASKYASSVQAFDWTAEFKDRRP